MTYVLGPEYALMQGLMMLIGILIVVLSLKALFNWLTEGERQITQKMYLIEETLLDKVALKKGFDLNKIMMKRDLSGRRELRDKLYKEMIKEMFDEEKKKKA